MIMKLRWCQAKSYTREPAVGQLRLPLGNFEQESNEGVLDRVAERLALQYTEHK